MNIFDRVCSSLEPGWSVRIDLENGFGGVTAIRPDGTEVSMEDTERDLEEQIVDAILLARDEARVRSLEDKLRDKDDEIEALQRQVRDLSSALKSLEPAW